MDVCFFCLGFGRVYLVLVFFFFFFFCVCVCFLVGLLMMGRPNPDVISISLCVYNNSLFTLNPQPFDIFWRVFKPGLGQQAAQP